MIVTHRLKRKTAVLIQGHRYYKKAKCNSKPHRLRLAFIQYLILSNNLISGVGAELLKDMDDSAHGHFGDELQLMARSRLEHLNQMPSPNERSDAHSDGSAGGDPQGSQGSHADSDEEDRSGYYYQMAFLFQQNGEVVTGRLNWSDYWKMHHEIAGLIGCHRDHLVAIFHVHHPPRDLEEMDAQAVLPIQAHEVRHNAAIIYMLVDVEMHENQRRSVVPTKRYSTHFPFEMTRTQLLQWIGVQEYCNILEDKCLVMVNHNIWPQQHVAHKNFASGDYIQCVLPPPEATECEVSRTTASDLLQVLSGEGEDDPEDISMMQRVAAPQEENTPSTVQTHTLHIFAYGSDYLEVPIEGEITTLIEHISETWFIDLQSIVDIYEVLEPPFLYQQPGEQTFVMEMRGDSSLKLMDDDRLILAEVRLNSKHSSRRWSNKYALWSRRLMGRQLALHLLRMQDFCKRRETKECALSHNNRIWAPQDRSEHVMSDGDYVLIEAFTEDISIQEARACLERFERHECSRRLFTVAEDAVPISGCDSGRGEADTTGTLRSRSRSRGASSGGRAQGGGTSGPGNH